MHLRHRHFQAQVKPNVSVEEMSLVCRCWKANLQSSSISGGWSLTEWQEILVCICWTTSCWCCSGIFFKHLMNLSYCCRTEGRFYCWLDERRRPTMAAVFSVVHLRDTDHILTSGFYLPLNYGQFGLQLSCMIVCALPLALVTTWFVFHAMMICTVCLSRKQSVVLPPPKH